MNPLHLFHITNIRIMQDITNGRCGWCGTDELYVKYHDQEWGKLVTDDKTLFEFLVLESAQAGLSLPCHSFPTKSRLSTHSGH